MKIERVRAGRLHLGRAALSRTSAGSPFRMVATVLALAVFLGPRAATPHVGSDPVVSAPSPGTAAEDGVLSADQMKAVYRADAEKPRYEGELLGWRIAPYSVLGPEGVTGQNIERSCKSFLAGPETPTQLDFTIGYLPDNIKVRHVYGPTKWVCGSEGLSVRMQFDVLTPLGVGEISIERVLRGDRVIEMDVAAGTVEVGKINGKDAILAHPLDDETGRGIGRIFVIEDDRGPDFTLLRIYADEGIPFAELVKIAEEIK